MSELVWGIKNGDLEQVKDIIEKKVRCWLFSCHNKTIHVICVFPQSVNVNDDIDGRPPILYAADYGQTDVIQYLISVGANVNVSNIFVAFFAHSFLFFFLSLKTNMELRRF